MSDPRAINVVGNEAPGPGHEAALLARNDVEAALFALPEIPLFFDRAGIRDRLLHAIECAYAVLDSPVIAAVHLDGLGEGSAIITESAALLARAGDPAVVPSLARALERLAAAAAALQRGAEAVAQIQFARRSELVGGGRNEGPPPALPFRASCGLPELHSLQRRPLHPHVVVDAAVQLPEPVAAPIAIPRPTNLDELKVLEADARSGALEKRLAGADHEPLPAPVEPLPYPYEPAVEETEILRRLARDCLEDIANQRSLRKPNAIESWLDQAPFEQRLLDNIDALAALGGGVLPQVSLFHAEARAPDPERAFAVALSLGCIAGNDTVGAAVTTLKQSPPEELPGWFEGFWLAPNPAIDAAMADLTTSARPDHVALGLDVLHARGRTPDDVVRRLLAHENARVAQRVARALATALPRVDAIEHLERLCAATSDDDVFHAAVEALLRRQHGPAVGILRSTVDSLSSPVRARRALPLLGLVGRASDRDRLLNAANTDPTARLLRSIGRWGHVESLGPLVNCLAHKDVDVVAAAAEALERITGAGLHEMVEELWEVELPPEAATAGGIAVPVRTVERVVIDPDRWTTWLRDGASSLDAKLKTRGGVPFTPLQIVAELEAKSTHPGCRDDAALEIALLMPIVSAFSPCDWVARQKRDLAELRTHVAAREASPGAWPSGDPRHIVAGTAAAASRSAAELVPSPRAEVLAPSLLDHDTSAPRPPAFVAVHGATTPPSDLGATGILNVSPEAHAWMAQGALPFGQKSPQPPTESRGTAERSKTLSMQQAVLPRSHLPFQPSHDGGPPAVAQAGEAAKVATPPPVRGEAPIPLASSTEPAPISESPITAPLPPIVPARPALPFGVLTPPAPIVMSPEAPPLDRTVTKSMPFRSQHEPQHAATEPPPPTRRPSGAEDTDSATLPPLVMSRPALPFERGQPTAPATTPLAASGGTNPLSLEQYAALCAELAVFPAQTAAIFQRYGLAAEHERVTVDLAWQERLRRDPAEHQEWQAHYSRYVVYWTRARGSR